jgi:hypothetical protein
MKLKIHEFFKNKHRHILSEDDVRNNLNYNYYRRGYKASFNRYNDDYLAVKKAHLLLESSIGKDFKSTRRKIKDAFKIYDNFARFMQHFMSKESEVCCYHLDENNVLCYTASKFKYGKSKKTVDNFIPKKKFVLLIKDRELMNYFIDCVKEYNRDYDRYKNKFMKTGYGIHDNIILRKLALDESKKRYDHSLRMVELIINKDLTYYEREREREQEQEQEKNKI